MSIKRTKNDEKLEKAIEEFILNWRVSIPTFGILIILAGIWKRDYLFSLIPVKQIEHFFEIWIPRLFLGIALILILLVVRKIFVYRWNKKHYGYLQILPHVDDGVKPDSLGEMLRRLHGTKRKPLERLVLGKEWYNFLIHYRKTHKGNQYVFYIGAHKKKLTSLKKHISSLYSRVEFHEPDDIRFPDSKAVGGRLKIKRKKLESNLSLARYKFDQIPTILNVMQPETWMQVSFSANNGWKLKKQIIKAEKEVKADKAYRDRTAFDKEEMKSYYSRFSGNEVAFDVLVSLASQAQDGVSVIKDTGNAIASMMHDVNELRYRRWRKAVKFFPTTYPYQMLWTGSELANLVHLPHFQQQGLIEKLIKVIPHTAKGSEILPVNVLSNPRGYSFGTLKHPVIRDREVRILLQALTKHFGLSGKSGSGKSTLLNQIFKSFLDEFLVNQHAPGFSFIDPKKETAVIVLNQLLKAELEGKQVNWNNVHWISFKNAQYPPAMNLLHRIGDEDDNLVTKQVMRIIEESSFSAAPQAERLLKKCIQTLIADKGRGHTILGIRSLLMKPKFLRGVLARIGRNPKYQELVQFWDEEAPDLMDTSKNAVLNRTDLFYENEFLRRMFGQPDFNFPIREWMDSGHIVIYDFSGMDDSEIGLVGGFLSYLYYRIADTRLDRSLVHLFCIDEAQRVKASILPEIVAEMRSKGLALGISTQYIQRLDRELQKTLANVAGNMFVCGQGTDGAKVAAEAFKVQDATGRDVQAFKEGFLMTLPARTAVIKTEDTIDGVEQIVQTVVEVPPLDRYKPDGTIADFHNKAEIDISNRWTMKKAKELESKNGLSVKEIDKYIRDYLSDKETMLSQNKPLMENVNQEKTENIEEIENEHSVQKETDHLESFDLFSEAKKEVSVSLEKEQVESDEGKKDKEKPKKDWSFMD